MKILNTLILFCIMYEILQILKSKKIVDISNNKKDVKSFGKDWFLWVIGGYIYLITGIIWLFYKPWIILPLFLVSMFEIIYIEHKKHNRKPIIKKLFSFVSIIILIWILIYNNGWLF